MHKEYITQAKKDSLEAELQELQTVERKRVLDLLEYAKALGDLSENSEYHEARDMQGVVEDRIQKLESVLKNAVIISSHHTEAVAVGSEVTVVKNGDKNEKVYTMVG